jgi:hypothetical protein
MKDKFDEEAQGLIEDLEKKKTKKPEIEEVPVLEEGEPTIEEVKKVDLKTKGNWKGHPIYSCKCGFESIEKSRMEDHDRHCKEGK